MAVTVKDLIKVFNFEVIVEGDTSIMIETTELNRPGLQLSGYYSYFSPQRIQLIGMTEWSYMNSLSAEMRNKQFKEYLSRFTPCIIVTRGLDIPESLEKYAKEYGRTILRSNEDTTRAISRLKRYLDEKLAPETRVHGVLVDIYGCGILITGDSGIGKSETALELIKRGHRIVSDDAVDFREIDREIIGYCPYITFGMLEVRGVGIIDITSIYGLSSVLESKKLDLIIKLEHWKDDESYDRLGVDNLYEDVLGVKIKLVRIPIRPGRNVSVLVEAAAANYRYKLTGRPEAIDIIGERMMDVYENNKTGI